VGRWRFDCDARDRTELNRRALREHGLAHLQVVEPGAVSAAEIL